MSADIDWAAARARSYDVRPARGTIVRTTHDTYKGGDVPAGTSIRTVTVDNAGFRGIELHGVAIDGPRAGDYIVGLSTGLVEVIA